MNRVLLALACAWTMAAQEVPPPPDPLGLGERLALIEALRETYGVTVTPGVELAELQSAYAAAWRARNPDESPERSAERDGEARLRQKIKAQFNHEVASEVTGEELSALYRQLIDDEAARDAAIIARRLTEPANSTAVPVVATTQVPSKQAASTTPEPTSSGPGVRPLVFPADGVAGAALITGTKTALCVQFGEQRAHEFDGVFPLLYARLVAGRGPRDAVFLLGHGTGVSINGAPIGPHLRANREFYETFGHTRPAQRLECIVIASCARGSPVQMSAMREGFGYYPTWRVATADRCYANALSVIAAFGAIADRPADTSWRGIFRMGREPDVVGSLGEVGIDGAKGGMVYFDIGSDGHSLTVTER